MNVALAIFAMTLKIFQGIEVLNIKKRKLFVLCSLANNGS